MKCASLVSNATNHLVWSQHHNGFYVSQKDPDSFTTACYILWHAMIVWNLSLLPVIACELLARGQVRLTSDACLIASMGAKCRRNIPLWSCAHT